MTVDPFAAMDEVQHRRARDVPGHIRQVLSVAELARAGALYYRSQSAVAWERLADAVSEWAEMNPAAAAALDEENE